MNDISGTSHRVPTTPLSFLETHKTNRAPVAQLVEHRAVILEVGHLRTLEKCRKHSPAARALKCPSCFITV